MVRLVTGAVGEAKRIVDLFCGIGTFTFPLAQRSPVLAVDGDKQAVSALENAAKRTPGLKPIENEDARSFSRAVVGARARRLRRRRVRSSARRCGDAGRHACPIGDEERSLRCRATRRRWRAMRAS
ncbi:MAG: hypothetical protein WDN31_17605 [Hyphomicrobium sp.]